MIQQQLHQLQQQLQLQQPQMSQVQQQQMLPQQQQMLPQQQQQMLPVRPRVDEAPKPLWRGSVDAGVAPEAQMPWFGTATTTTPPLEVPGPPPLPLWNGSSELNTGIPPPPPEEDYLHAVAEQQLQEGFSIFQDLNPTVEHSDANAFLPIVEEFLPSIINGSDNGGGCGSGVSSGVDTGIPALMTLPAAAVAPFGAVEAPLGAAEAPLDYLDPPPFIEAAPGPAVNPMFCQRDDSVFSYGEGEFGTPMSQPPMSDVFQQSPQPFTMMPDSQATTASAGSSTGPFGYQAELGKPTDSLALGLQLSQQQQAPSRRQPCRFWLRGLCERGVNCLWPHENTEPMGPPSLPPPSLPPPSVPPVWARSNITNPPSLPPRERPVVFSTIKSAEPIMRRTICKFWQEGKCSRGVGCTFAHGEVEIGTMAGTSGRPEMAPAQPALPLFDPSRHKGSLSPFSHVASNQAKRPRFS